MTSKEDFGNFFKKVAKTKNPLEVANEEVRFSEDAEFGLITVEHPEKKNSKKLGMKDVIKKMDNNQGGMA